MINRIALLRVVSIVVMTAVSGGVCAQDQMNCILPNDGMNDDEIVLLVTGLILVGTNLVLVAHNTARLNADDPSGPGGMGGILFGALGMAYGVMCIGSSDEPAVRFTGMGCAAAGAASFYFGVRSAMASNRKYDEAEEGLTFDPVLIDDGSGRLEPGVQVRWSF